MNYKLLNEIETKRKKFLKGTICLFLIVIIVSVLLAFFKLSDFFALHPLYAILFEAIFLLPVFIAMPIVLSEATKNDIAKISIYDIAGQITGFKPIALSNTEGKDYDAYLPSEIDWNKLPTPPEKVLFDTILPKFDIYNIKLKTMFNGVNELNHEIKMCDLSVFKDWGYGIPTKEFAALLLTVKTDKNLNSITCFQTSDCDEDKLDNNLPKIKVNGKIKVYGNNESIAQKLATPELISILHTLRKQFDVIYAKAVFYNEYIVFVLRDMSDEKELFSYFPLGLSLLRPFDISKKNKAVANFQTLYDLTNRAPDFTKNI